MYIKNWFITCVLVLFSIGTTTLHAQYEKGNVIDFTRYHSIGDTTSIATVLTNDSLFHKQPPEGIKNSKKDAYWLKIDFSEQLQDLEKDTLWFLYTRVFYESTFYYWDKDSISKTKYGIMNRDKFNISNQPTNGVFFNKNNLINGQFLLLKINTLSPNQNFENYQIKYITYKDYKKETHAHIPQKFKKEIPVYLFLGAFIFIFVFSLITYFTSKRHDFLFYSLYILCLFLYLGKSAFGIEDYINTEYTLISFWSHSQLQIFINLFYVAFAKYYLNSKEVYKKLDKAIKIISFVLIGFIILGTLLVLLGDFFTHRMMMNAHRFIMSLFAIGSFIYLVRYAKNTLAYFIVIGSLAFLAGSLAMLFTLDKNYMIAGAVIEVLLFGLGLNYKLKLINEEKLILKQVAFDNKISALRAQMNPHFIFNSLNSIQHLITSGKKEAAVKYLNKFSLLMRSLLESSIESNIVLSEEINLLHKYLELESLRFDQAFSYQIEVHESINPDAVEVPILIVQPFVENAILHGLLIKKDGDKKLHILFRKEKNTIICEVDDNGIGRQASEQIKPYLKRTGKSRGISVTENRLQIQNQLEEDNITIIDKVDENGQATGTKVIIKIQID